METEVDKGVQIGLTIYEFVIPIIAAAIVWISLKLSAWIKAKTKNELAAGMLIRLNASVTEAVTAVNQRMKDLIGKARSPGSPGGVTITKEEAGVLKNEALAHVKSYWGAKGINELASVLGFGGLFGVKQGGKEGLEKMITNKIEAAVGAEKASLASINPTKPAT